MNALNELARVGLECWLLASAVLFGLAVVICGIIDWRRKPRATVERALYTAVNWSRDVKRHRIEERAKLAGRGA